MERPEAVGKACARSIRKTAGDDIVICSINTNTVDISGGASLSLAQWRSGGPPSESRAPESAQRGANYHVKLWVYARGFEKGAKSARVGRPPPNGRSPGISMPVPHYSSWRDPKLSLLEERVYYFWKRRRLERLPLVELGMTARCKTPTRVMVEDSILKDKYCLITAVLSV